MYAVHSPKPDMKRYATFSYAISVLYWVIRPVSVLQGIVRAVMRHHDCILLLSVYEAFRMLEKYCACSLLARNSRENRLTERAGGRVGVRGEGGGRIRDRSVLPTRSLNPPSQHAHEHERARACTRADIPAFGLPPSLNQKWCPTCGGCIPRALKVLVWLTRTPCGADNSVTAPPCNGLPSNLHVVSAKGLNSCTNVVLLRVSLPSSCQPSPTDPNL